MINIIPKNLTFVLLIFSASCLVNRKNNPVEIIIKSNESYKYDLSKFAYTIFYSAKPPIVISFHLSHDEMEEIQHKYYSLNIDKIIKKGNSNAKIQIEDKCNTMPKNNTILNVQTKDRMQEIQIDLYCNSFYLSNSIEANHVKQFISFIIKIIRSKQEIKNAPLSDIMYM